MSPAPWDLSKVRIRTRGWSGRHFPKDSRRIPPILKLQKTRGPGVTGRVTAYMDMEFGGICGTWQRMKVPVEVGIVVHDETKNSLGFFGRKFVYDLDITVWKNITDDLGRTIGKNPCSLNPSKNGHGIDRDRRHRLEPEERKKAYRTSRLVHTDLREFMRDLNAYTISTVVFFAADYERTALGQARVNLEGFEVRDLQRDIKTTFSMKEVMSLDRLSYVTGFRADLDAISSRHFRYPVPPAYRDWLDAHTAVGDAARMFLLSQELHFHPGELRAGIEQYLAKCEEMKKTNGDNDAVVPDKCAPG